MASEVMAVALTKELSNSEVDLLTVTSVPYSTVKESSSP